MFITVSDFAGKYEIHTGMYDQSRIQSYIDDYEEQYLRHLLGVELYNDFKADLDQNNVPQTQKFTTIFEPLNEDLEWTIIESEGIKKMLLGFVYFEYVKDQMNRASANGNVIPQSETGDIASTLSTTMYNRYNKAIKSYKAIQEYIMRNRADYPNFNGMRKYMMTWI